MYRRIALWAAIVTVGLGASGVRAQEWQGWQVTDLRGQNEPLGLITRSETPATVSYGPTIVAGSLYATPAPAQGYSPPAYAAPAYPGPNYAAPAVSYDASAVTYRPIVPQYRVQYAPQYYAPQYVPQYVPQYAAPAVAYRPAVMPYTVPVAGYRPVVPAAYTAPYVAYSPTVATAYGAGAYAAPAAAGTGPKVIVKPKVVWVEGQPIRNLLRAITP